MPRARVGVGRGAEGVDGEGTGHVDKAYTERAAGFFRKGELVRTMRGGKVMLCYDILFPRFLYIVEHRSICAFVPSTNHNQILDKEGNICPTFNIPVSATVIWYVHYLWY